jgi:hypothetical protein
MASPEFSSLFTKVSHRKKGNLRSKISSLTVIPFHSDEVLSVNETHKVPGRQFVSESLSTSPRRD